MYASFAALFAVLALASLLAARRERAFLFAALAGVVGFLDGLVWGIEPSLGGISLGLGMLFAATIVAVAEALGLPRALARVTRLGIRNVERDFDWRLWRLMQPLWSMLRAVAEAEGATRPGQREHLLRTFREVVERLGRLQPPTEEWRSVRDGYVEAVRVALGALLNGASEVEQLRAFREASGATLTEIAALRSRYRPLAPPAPPWAVLAFVVVVPLVSGRALDLVDRGLEAVNPPPVAVGWQAIGMPFAYGDGWVGNAISDEHRLYLMSREEIDGFWGVVRVRSSADAGRTWSTAGAASITGSPDFARPAMALAPDGSIWEALVRIGDEPSTQRLWLGRSTDGGETWQGFARASPLTTGLVGLPALLVTPEVQLVAFTDGATGAAMIQPLYLNGLPQPAGNPITLGTTSRQLYSDANFLDAGFALAASGRHVVALWHPSDGVINVSISDDAGRTWRTASPLTTSASSTRPHLVLVGDRFVALDGRSSATGVRTWLQLDTSNDGGQTWTSGPTVSNGLFATEGAIDVSARSWRLVYAACPGEIGCITPERVWYRESADGVHWSDPQALTQPRASIRVIGVGEASGRLWAIWTRDPDAMAERRVVEGLVR